MVSSDRDGDLPNDTDKILSEKCFETIVGGQNSEENVHHHEPMVKDELLGVDPFCHKIEMPTWMW